MLLTLVSSAVMFFSADSYFLFFNDARYERRDKNFHRKIERTWCTSPMDDEQLSETKLAMKHLGLLQ